MEHDILIESYIEDLYLSEDLQYVDESIKKFMSKITPSKVKQLLSKVYAPAAAKDMPAFLSLVKKYGLDAKRIKPKEAAQALKQLPEEIQQGAKLSARVLKNSVPKASKDSISAASYYIAILTKVKNKKSVNYMGALKSELKNYVSKVRQFYEEADEQQKQTGGSTEDIADVAIAIATVVTLATVTYIVVSSLAVMIPILLWTAVVTVAGVGIGFLIKIFLD